MAKKKNRINKVTIRLTPEEYKHFLVKWRASYLSQADYLMRLVDNVPVQNGELIGEYRAIKDKLDELQQDIKKLEPKP